MHTHQINILSMLASTESNSSNLAADIVVENVIVDDLDPLTTLTNSLWTFKKENIDT